MMNLRVIPQCLAACLILVACSSSSTYVSPPPPPPPGPPPPPPPPAAQHLYVGDDDIPGTIRVYDLPLSASSTPVASVPMNAALYLGVNSTTLAVTRLDNFSISFFALPITSASVPYATVASGSAGTPIFLASGALYHGGVDTINVYTPPFTSASVPSSKISTPNLTPTILAIGPDGTVYEPAGNVIAVLSGGVVTTRLTAPPGTGFEGLAASATQLFACEATGSAYAIYVYSLPLTASATPAVVFDPKLTSPQACVLDASGNLYVGAGSQIAVFAPPFTTASTRTVLLTRSDGGIDGMAIGP
jgi:hypothetical protein